VCSSDLATQEIVVFSGLYLVYVFVMIAAAEKYYQSINLWVNEEVIIYERGWLFPKRTVVKLHKFQTVELNQTIFQAKRNICHLTFSTAAGGRSFRFFDKSEMEELRDFVLYKTESFTGKWM
jgi:putative membrane protein